MSVLQLSVRVLYASTTLFAAGLLVVLWRHREKAGALPLMLGNFGAGFWSLGLLVSTAPWPGVAEMAIRVMYLGVGIAPLGAFLFALEYTGRERYITRPVLAVLGAHPIIVLLLAVFNPGNLFFESLDPGVMVSVEQEWATLFWIHSAYEYTLMMAAIVMILQFLYRSKSTLYRGQSASLLIAIASPVVFNGVFTTGTVNFDTTPVGFLVLSGALTFAILRYEFANLSPIARNKVIENVREGMLVVDEEGYVLDSNPAVEHLFGLDDAPVGDHFLTDTLGEFPALQAEFENVISTTETIEETVPFGQRYLRVDATPITDDQHRAVGTLLLMEDVTEQVQRERDLEQQVEKLDQFASLVSHDLRNPLNVGRIYVQQALETGDIDHLEDSEEALDRMESIIDDVLTLTREGENVTEPTKTPLKKVTEAAWASVDTGDAALDVTPAAERTVILADESRLQRLFENLFRNAVEHGTGDTHEASSFPESELTVTVDVSEDTGSSVSVIVADNGIGVPQDDREDVFESGYSTGQGGTGLGLSIVEQIANGHGWAVEIGESEAGGTAIELSEIRKPVRVATAQ